MERSDISYIDGASMVGEMISYNGKIYTQREWNDLISEVDEIGMLLELCDEGSVYDSKTKRWRTNKFKENKE